MKSFLLRMIMRPKSVGRLLPPVCCRNAFGSKLGNILGMRQICGARSRLPDHIFKRVLIVKQRTWPQIVFTERLLSVIAHEQRWLQSFKQRFLPYIGIGIMYERTRLYIAVGINVKIWTSCSIISSSSSKDRLSLLPYWAAQKRAVKEKISVGGF